MRKKKETLLQRREREFEQLVFELLDLCDTLKKCYEGKYSDLRQRVIEVYEKAAKARMIGFVMQELRDVEKYGPTGE